MFSIQVAFGFNGVFNNPLQGEVWVAGKEIKIEWLAGNTPIKPLPVGYPVNLNIYALNSDNSIYRQITYANPSEWARWIYPLPTDWAAGTYKFQLCDTANPTDCIVSPSVTVQNPAGNAVVPSVTPIIIPYNGQVTSTLGGSSENSKPTGKAFSAASRTSFYASICLAIIGLLQ